RKFGLHRLEGHFPGLAAIRRVVLLVFVRCGCHVGPGCAHEDRAAVERVLLKKLSLAVVERPDETWGKDSCGTADESLAPLMSRRVIEEQAHALPMSFGTVRLDLFDLRLPTPYLADRDGPAELHRLRRV